MQIRNAIELNSSYVNLKEEIRIRTLLDWILLRLFIVKIHKQKPIGMRIFPTVFDLYRNALYLYTNSKQFKNIIYSRKVWNCLLVLITFSLRVKPND